MRSVPAGREALIAQPAQTAWGLRGKLAQGALRREAGAGMPLSAALTAFFDLAMADDLRQQGIAAHHKGPPRDKVKSCLHGDAPDPPAR